MSLSKKRIVFLLFMLLAGSVFTLFYLAAAGNGPQVYTDIVIEYTSIFSSNKSAERKLVYLLIFAGVACYGIYFIRSCSRRGNKGWDEAEEQPDDARMLLCFLGFMAAASYFIFVNPNPVLIASIFVLLMILFTDRSLAMDGFIFFYMGIYAVYGLYRIYVFAGGRQSLGNVTAAFLMTMAAAGLLACKDKRKALRRGCLIEQLCIPAVLLVYLADRYSYNGEMAVVPAPGQVKVLIFVLAVSFLAEAGFLMKKNWKEVPDVNRMISFGSCVCIMTFNRFSGSGAVIAQDMHHPFENIIGYSQVFELGQKLFSEYIPVSGMYSIIQGAVFRFFGNGEVGNYYVTQNVFYLLAILLVMVLLCAQASRKCVFLIALVFPMSDYNRIVFILPVMLLLMMPKLVKRKNLWLKAWFLTSLFHGLYYPVFGAAVCAAFLPLGIWQAVTYAKSGRLRADAGTVRFWAEWMVCMIPAAVCIPCLAGTYRHIKAMAGQTIYADGIARFGQLVPDWFFSYLNQYQVIRIVLYDVLSFMIPAGFVWAAFALALKAGGAGVSNRRITLKNPQGAAAAMSLAIMPAVCYTYTVVRLDTGNLYARSAGPLFAAAVLMLVIMEQYVGREKVRYFVICAAVFIPAAVNSIGFFSSGSKLSAYETVPENYVYIEHGEVEKLGTGFLAQNVYDSAVSAHAAFSNEDPERSYFGKGGNFGFFYLNDVKGDGVIEAGTVRGYEAAQEAIDIVRENGTIIGTDINPLCNYYLYHWLLTSGEYIWSGENGCFMPNDGGMTADAVREAHKNLTFSWDGFDAAKNAGSLGQSMDSLSRIFSASDTEFAAGQAENALQVDFTEVMDGDDADFMYLEFADMDQNFQYTLFQLDGEQEQDGGFLAKYLMKKNYNPGMQVCVFWMDDNGQTHTMYCAMGQGKLLIPLGSGVNWLLHKHSFVQVNVMQDGQVIPLPQAAKIQFLKLREAGQK